MYPATQPFRTALTLLLLATLAGCDFGSGCCGAGDPSYHLVLDGLTKGREISEYLAEEEMDQIGSGNAILGQGGPVAVPGKVSASLRFGRAARSVPTLAGTTLSEVTSASSVIPVTSASVMKVQLDVALPVIAGFTVGESKIFSFELLGSATLLGKHGASDLNVQQGTTTLGFGSRLGILRETHGLPGIAITSMRRSVPALSWEARGIPTAEGHEATLGMNDFSGKLTSHRISAAKEFGVAGVTVGWGRDLLNGEYIQTALVNGETPTRRTERPGLGGRRSVLFVGGSYALRDGVQLAAEVIRSTRTAPLYPINQVGTEGRSRTHLTVGVRVGG